MATTSVSNISQTSCMWLIDYLENDFNTNYYISAGVALNPATYDSTTPPSGIMGSASAHSPDWRGNYAQGYAYGFSPGTTYTLYGYTRAANGRYYPAGSVTFTTLPSGPVRPSNFSWTYPKVSGGVFNLTAAEWNSFTARINAFRAYKGLSNYSFTTAVSGNNFTAAMFNEARAAISAMGISVPAVQYSDNTIYASLLNDIVSALNSIT